MEFTVLHERKLSPMVAGFQVHEEWQKNTAEYARRARTAFVVALSTVAITVMLVLVSRLYGEWRLLKSVHLVEAVWLAYFAVGSWCITRTVVRRLYFYLLITAGTFILLLAASAAVQA